MFGYGNLLFLMPSAAKQIMPFLEREFPRLVKRYRKLYARSAYLNGDYKDEVSQRVAALCARYGLDGRDDQSTAWHPQPAFPFSGAAKRADC